MATNKRVVIIGSGFGGSVCALRYAEAGFDVTVLERGGWVSREDFEADDDMFWQPSKGRYGMNDLQLRGRHIVPWVGSAVGGGSHVYAATIKRREFFDDFPSGITYDEMAPYYQIGEDMMQVSKYPDYPPYSELPSYQIFRNAQRAMSNAYPNEVEEHGDILLALSFAPKGKSPGETFTNKYGARQRYSDPEEQKLLGGDIDVKNTLDKNYLFEAQKHGAEILDFHRVDKIEKSETGYFIHWSDPRENMENTGALEADLLIIAAGAIGSTELLMKSKYYHQTLPLISDMVGSTYFTNGDYVTGLIPKRGLLLSWVGLIATLVFLIMGMWIPSIFALLIYGIGWWRSDKKSHPDSGPTNSDYIRFKGRDGKPQGMYIEGGRYPTPVKAMIAIVLSLTGNYKPSDYKKINKVINWMGKYIPIVELIQRSWPIPILMMGRDEAIGSYYLNKNHEIEIEFPFEKNKDYLFYLNTMGKRFSEYADAYFVKNGFATISKIVEVPHNMGGASMGDSIDDGVVDSYGRVYGYDNLIVMDGSIMPNSLGPNPVGTILAFAERSCDHLLK